MRKEKTLAEKKERLFRAKDVTKWGYPEAAVVDKMKSVLLEDKDKAF